VSLFRAFDAQIEAPRAGRPQSLIALGLLKGMGHLPFDHITPDGYTDYASLWIDNMLLRWNAAILTVYGVLPGVKMDIAGLVKGQNVALTPRAVLDYFGQHLLGRPLAKDELDAIWGFVTKKGEPNLTTDAGRKRLGDAIALIAASPAFQYR
jgi:Protein of unknown function (DUF1800)